MFYDGSFIKRALDYLNASTGAGSKRRVNELGTENLQPCIIHERKKPSFLPDFASNDGWVIA